MKCRIMLLVTLALTACGKEDALPPAMLDNTATTAPAALPLAVEVPRSYANSIGETGWFPLDQTLVAAATERHRCTVERINGEKPVRGRPIAVAAGMALALNGWTSDAVLQSPSRFLFVLDDGDHAYASNGTTGRARPDVAAALQSEGAAQAGFYVNSMLVGVAPGAYTLKLLGEAGGQYSLCVSPATLVVGGS